ncbi:MAG: hypothetical protein AABY22_28730, partial [Nanoarchaeota archaeon]
NNDYKNIKCFLCLEYYYKRWEDWFLRLSHIFDGLDKEATKQCWSWLETGILPSVKPVPIES